MDSEHYTITDTSISPSDFKCRVLCMSMTIQYLSDKDSSKNTNPFFLSVSDFILD